MLKRKIIEYINKVIGIKVTINLYKTNNIPKYLINDFDFFKITINNKDYILLIVKNISLTPLEIKRRVEKVNNITQLDSIISMDKMEAYERDRLIKNHVPFIIPYKQLYIPDQFIDLREYFDAKNKKYTYLTPSAQLLIFYHLFIDNIEGASLNFLSNKFKYSKMTFSRAFNLLNSLEIIDFEYNGKEKRIKILNEKYEIWEKINNLLINPIKNTYKVNKLINKEGYFISGINALSKYTNILSDNKKVYAIYKKNFSENFSNKYEDYYDSGITIELWNYDPNVLSKHKNYVDPFSLFAIYKNSYDERINKAINEMIKKIL